MMYGQRGEYDMAETSLRKALEIEPNSAPVQFNLGLLMVEKGNAGQAEKDFRAALDLDPRLGDPGRGKGISHDVHHDFATIWELRRCGRRVRVR